MPPAKRRTGRVVPTIYMFAIDFSRLTVMNVNILSDFVITIRITFSGFKPNFILNEFSSFLFQNIIYKRRLLRF